MEESEFDDQGRRLLPLRGLPKELMRDLMVMQGGKWTTDEIRKACDLMDEWFPGLPEPPKTKNRGRRKGAAGSYINDAAALTFMRANQGANSTPNGLANLALDFGFPIGRGTRDSAVRRLVAKLKSDTEF